MDKNLTWSFAQVWNKSLEDRSERELKPREHIWASEVGGSYIDRYLKMKATAFTNPPNPRSLRKFEAGNIMEWIVGLVLKRAGILLDNQEWLEYTYPGLLRVTGKLDFYAGGNPNWEKAKTDIQALELPEFFDRATDSIVDYFSKQFPDGLKKVVFEIKSCGSMMFDRYERTGRANRHHELQLFHYLKAKDMDEGHIVYISKDDLRLQEIGVFNPSPVEEDYKGDIARMTEILRSGKEPEKEPMVIFENGRFSKNWKVEYSNYLTRLYGFKEPKEYADQWEPMVGRWNRVMTRIVDGANMTDNNKQAIEEIKKEFSNFDELVSQAKEVRATEPEEEEVEA